jgi:ATP-dependent protease ClpP protease subunit
MVHGVTTNLFHSDQRDINAEKKLTDYLCDWAAKFYMDRCKTHDLKWWSEVLSDKSPHYLSPEEALRDGLVDEVRE